jgi:ATP-dependent RNA helicase DeaD
MENFSKLGIIEPIIKVIQEEQFEEPSEIQEKSIPLVVQGRDVIGAAATGSGKTLAFASGIIKFCEKNHGIQALVLTPTRELAEQVAKSIKNFAKYKPLFVTSIYGGVSMNPQMDHLRRADVVVATPGRLLDHLERRNLSLQNIKMLILDEADRMFDMGFIEDVQRIISQCSKQRQTLLFSATINNEVAELARRYMNNPVKVSAESYVDPKKLIQVYYDVQDNLKFSLLVHLLKNEETNLVMVFCNTQKITDFVEQNLKANGIAAQAIHGGFSQAKRSRTMDAFKAQNIRVLVCTDVAARGLDIKNVTHVYNYDIPKEAKQYIHRVGRTARAGTDGKAINILSSRDHDNFRRVLREHSDMNIVKVQTPHVEQVRVTRTEQSSFGRGFHRGSGSRHFGSDRPRRFGSDRGSRHFGSERPPRAFGERRSY